jgi:hypothetical protein
MSKKQWAAYKAEQAAKSGKAKSNKTLGGAEA